MVRHLLRAAAGSTVLVVCLIFLPGQAWAQGAAGLGVSSGGILNDPFSFYYAVYLPNQQLQSLRPSPNDSIDSAMATRQYYAQNDRQGLYNPISPYADQNYDPLHPYSRQQGTERTARPYRRGTSGIPVRSRSPSAACAVRNCRADCGNPRTTSLPAATGGCRASGNSPIHPGGRMRRAY